jgi:hypothetical protein
MDSHFRAHLHGQTIMFRCVWWSVMTTGLRILPRVQSLIFKEFHKIAHRLNVGSPNALISVFSMWEGSITPWRFLRIPQRNEQKRISEFTALDHSHLTIYVCMGHFQYYHTNAVSVRRISNMKRAD